MVNVYDWSITPSNNGTVDGVNVAEGAAAKGMNNALRAIMSGVASLFDSADNTNAGAALQYYRRGDFSGSQIVLHTIGDTAQGVAKLAWRDKAGGYLFELAQSGDAKAYRDFAVGRNLAVTGTLTNTGAATFNGMLTANAGLTVAAGGLAVTGAATFNTGVTITAGGLAVSGAASMGGAFSVAGATTLQATTATSLSVAGSPAWTQASLTNLNQLVNGPGYITGINSGMVTTALGYTPYNATNPSGFINGINSGMVTTALGYTPLSTVGTAANSSALSGLAASSSDTANTIAARNSSGYLLAKYFQMNSGNVGSAPPVSYVTVGSNASDGYFYQVTNAHFISQLGLRTTSNLTALSQLTNDSGFITGSGYAYPRRSDGNPIAINWSEQSGTPSYVIGGSDGTNFYVYNPANFSVNYATTAGSAPANGGNSATVAGYGVSVGNAASTIMARDGSGIAYAADYYVASDEKLKTQIKPLDGRLALAGIRRVGGKRYAKGGKLELGIIAQQAQISFPEQVHKGEDGFLHVGNMNGPIFAALGYIADRLEAEGILL